MSLVTAERRDTLAIITLNNPEKYNALGSVLLDDLMRALDKAVEEWRAGAIVLTGAGKGFCAGAQFGTDVFEAGERIGDWMRASINPVIEKMRASPVPIVVAVNGPAAGAGVGLALAGDVVIAARSARFVLSFVRSARRSTPARRVPATVDRRAAHAGAGALGRTADRRNRSAMGPDLESGRRRASHGRGVGLAGTSRGGAAVAIGLIKAQLGGRLDAAVGQTVDAEATAQSPAFATEDLREGAAALSRNAGRDFRAVGWRRVGEKRGRKIRWTRGKPRDRRRSKGGYGHGRCARCGQGWSHGVQPTRGRRRAPRAGQDGGGNLLPTAARRFRDREAFFCASTGRRFTFGQTNERCNRLAHGLAAFGLAKPDTVAFLCNNRAELPEIYYALAKTGLVGIPLNYRLAPAEIVALMSAMGAQGDAVRDPLCRRGRTERARSLPQVKSFVAIGDDGPEWASAYEDLLAAPPATEPDVEVEESRSLLFQPDLGTDRACRRPTF